jgi:hypothetical protein
MVGFQTRASGLCIRKQYSMHIEATNFDWKSEEEADSSRTKLGMTAAVLPQPVGIAIKREALGVPLASHCSSS